MHPNDLLSVCCRCGTGCTPSCLLRQTVLWQQIRYLADTMDRYPERNGEEKSGYIYPCWPSRVGCWGSSWPVVRIVVRLGHDSSSTCRNYPHQWKDTRHYGERLAVKGRQVVISAHLGCLGGEVGRSVAWEEGSCKVVGGGCNSWGEFLNHFSYMWKNWDPLTWAWPQVAPSLKSPMCIAIYCRCQAISHSLAISRDPTVETEKRARVRPNCAVWNIWTIGAMDRTSAPPQVNLSRLRSFSLKTGPLISADEAGIILSTENMRVN